MTREELWDKTEKLANDIESMKFLVQNKPQSSFSAQGILAECESINIAEFSYRVTELHNEYLKILREWAKKEDVF